MVSADLRGVFKAAYELFKRVFIDVPGDLKGVSEGFRWF